MKDGYAYLAAFDLDKTILEVNSSRLIVKSSREKGFMSRQEFWNAVYYSILYKFDLRNHRRIVEEMTAWLKDLVEAEVKELIELNIVPVLKGLIRPEILKEIEQHRQANAKLIILSSAMPYLCNPIADYLGFDDVVCSSLETKDGKFTGKANGRLVFDEEKAVRMEKYCAANGFPLSDAWYYGDAFTDRFVLDIVGNPVAVKPEIKLKMRARRRGWKVI